MQRVRTGVLHQWKYSKKVKAKLSTHYNVKHAESECLWVDLHVGSHKLSLCGLYRGLYSSQIEKYIESFKQIKLSTEATSYNTG